MEGEGEGERKRERGRKGERERERKERERKRVDKFVTHIDTYMYMYNIFSMCTVRNAYMHMYIEI